MVARPRSGSRRRRVSNMSSRGSQAGRASAGSLQRPARRGPKFRPRLGSPRPRPGVPGWTRTILAAAAACAGPYSKPAAPIDPAEPPRARETGPDNRQTAATPPPANARASNGAIILLLRAQSDAAVPLALAPPRILPGRRGWPGGGAIVGSGPPAPGCVPSTVSTVFCMHDCGRRVWRGRNCFACNFSLSFDRPIFGHLPDLPPAGQRRRSAAPPDTGRTRSSPRPPRKVRHCRCEYGCFLSMFLLPPVCAFSHTVRYPWTRVVPGHQHATIETKNETRAPDHGSSTLARGHSGAQHRRAPRIARVDTAVATL